MRAPDSAFLSNRPELTVCGGCGWVVHQHHVESHMRRCLDAMLLEDGDA